MQQYCSAKIAEILSTEPHRFKGLEQITSMDTVPVPLSLAPHSKESQNYDITM
jgi:hypothetical protein